LHLLDPISTASKLIGISLLSCYKSYGTHPENAGSNPMTGAK
jgi:hypothetical protein